MNSFESGPSFDPFGEEVPFDVYEALEIRAAQLDWDDPTEVTRFEIDLAYAQDDYNYQPDQSYEPFADYEELEAQKRWEAKRFASQEQREQIFERDGGQCHYCDRQVSFKGFQADHKTPFSKGGPTTLENLVCACYACNKAKFAMDYDEFVEKLAANGLEWRDKERDRVIALLFHRNNW